jgi:hypothetical protein
MKNGNLEPILKKLSQLCSDLDRWYDINKGGCCYVAYLIATNLWNLKIKYKLVVCDRGKTCKALKMRRDINSLRLSDYSFNHYFIEVDGFPINMGCFNKKVCYQSKASYINPFCIGKIYTYFKERDGWNETYKLRYNPIVKDTINKFFEENEECIRQIVDARRCA